MDPSFWQNRWREGRIGFHLPHPNPQLVAHAGQLPPSSRVLVPLCGKSVDLGWLAARGHPVVGVELVESAAQAFFAEAGLTPERQEDGPFVRYRAGGVEIFTGDFFATDPRRLGTFDAAFDRAALIALPGELRIRYAAHLRTLLAPGAVMLLVTIEADAPGGPPFAVPEVEVRTLYARDEVALLGDTDALEP
ncbi:MAG: hypothetical protein ACK4N5_03750, partial [Myxococcales bacterium]